MEKRMDAVMTDEQVVRYTQLTARRMEIVMQSGASWKPEYAQELEEIDAELAALRQRVDAALEAKEARTENALADTGQLNAFEDYSKTVRSELRSLIGLFEDVLSDPRPVDEIKEQMDQHLANMDQAADRYWQSRDVASSEDPLPCSDEHDDLDFDAMVQLQLDAEVRQARLNGGRTDYLFDDDGNEYYTTVDGVRHYTRDEG